MGSTRLPGKVLTEVAGKPMLKYQIDRVRQSTLLDKIIVATSTLHQDDVIEKFCRLNGIEFFRGSENDVLDRYYQAAKTYKVQHIVRLTGDNPLISPMMICKVIDFYWLNNFDYVSNNRPRTYPMGLDVEIFTFEALGKAWREAKDNYEKEHVTPYIYNHPELFKIGNVRNDRDLSYIRWTVDTLEDLAHVRELCDLVSK